MKATIQHTIRHAMQSVCGFFFFGFFGFFGGYYFYAPATAPARI